mmetsp:Transcript_24646/g.69302  ORF Transcript_24646/g.69302 Transcript_24646/m.69302 type:complete len:239 (+) Transcript_24646:1720-2436(+)
MLPEADRAPVPPHGRRHPRIGAVGEGREVPGAAGPLPVHAAHDPRRRGGPQPDGRRPGDHRRPGLEPRVGRAGRRPRLPDRPAEGGLRVQAHPQRPHRGQDVPAPGLQDGPHQDRPRGGQAAHLLHGEGDPVPFRVDGPRPGGDAEAAHREARRGHGRLHHGDGRKGRQQRLGRRLAQSWAGRGPQRLQRPLQLHRAGGGRGGRGLRRSDRGGEAEARRRRREAAADARGEAGGGAET